MKSGIHNNKNINKIYNIKMYWIPDLLFDYEQCSRMTNKDITMQELRTTILDIPIDKIGFFDALKKIDELIQSGGHHQVATVNPEFIMHAQKDEVFREALMNSSLNTADGIGIIWASKFVELRRIFNFQFSIFNFGLLLVSLAAIILNRKWLSSEIPERVTGIDLMWELANRSQERGWRVFLLGGFDGVAEAVADKLTTLYPKLNIVGTCGGKNPDNKEDYDYMIQCVAEKKPDLLFVAFGGSPKQEKFIYKNLDKLRSKVAIGVGGSFNFIAGNAKRAPMLFQKIGIEWLWRFISQPTRVGRIFNAFPKFIWKVYNSK